MPMKGKVHKLGNDINTDYVISGRYKFAITDPKELGKHVFEDLDPELASNIKEGDFIVAGDNFGCGSSREQAPQALKATGIQAVIAKYFARIFYRNAINLGIPVIECAETDRISDQDEIEIDLASGEINNLTKNETYKCSKIPPHIMELVADGGLVPYLKKRV